MLCNTVFCGIVLTEHSNAEESDYAEYDLGGWDFSCDYWKRVCAVIYFWGARAPGFASRNSLHDFMQKRDRCERLPCPVSMAQVFSATSHKRPAPARRCEGKDASLHVFSRRR